MIFCNGGLLLLFCYCWVAGFPTEISANKIGRKCGNVYLTVSSYHDTYLELNWITDCAINDTIPEYILLYNTNPGHRNEQPNPLVRLSARNYPNGYHITRIKFGQPWLPGKWEYHDALTSADPGPHCFPYWITSMKGSEIIDSKCLSIQPTWMNDNSLRIGNQKIGSLLLPGTHNSGSFKGVPQILENYVLNQDRSIWTQLVHGIRYFDLRIGFYENEGFYINHDLVRITKIVPVFKEIKKFMELAPKEIVILDFHRFPYPSNFNSTLHNIFVSLIHEHLGDLALPPGGLQVGKGPTLNEIWSQNKNLVICYGNKNIARNNYWLWQPLQQHWANTKNVHVLKNFLQKAIKEHHLTLNPMFALMAELTPQPIDLFLRTNNLRKLANDVNRKVAEWFKDGWIKEANVIATDYFLGNDIITLAIDVNNNKIPLNFANRP